MHVRAVVPERQMCMIRIYVYIIIRDTAVRAWSSFGSFGFSDDVAASVIQITQHAAESRHGLAADDDRHSYDILYHTTDDDAYLPRRTAHVGRGLYKRHTYTRATTIRRGLRFASAKTVVKTGRNLYKVVSRGYRRSYITRHVGTHV